MTDLNIKCARRLFAVSLGLSALLLAGCAGPSAMRSSYIEYSHAQAQVNNQQTLLNLARVRNGHPPYFLQLGTMTANFSFTRGINGSYNRVETPMVGLASTVSQMLAINGSSTEAPMFSYAPLGGPNFSAVLMRPVDARVFNGLAVQGFPLTVLLRMLTDTAQLSASGGPALDLHNYLDPKAPENYGDFLRLVSVLQTLQQSRLLTYAIDPTGSVLRIGTDARAAPVLASLAQGTRTTLKGATLAAGMSVDIRSRTFAGVLFLGAVTDAMLLGHWYLVQPGLPRRHLNDLVRAVGWVWPVEVIAMLLPVGMFAVFSGRIDDGWSGQLGWMWVACAITTIVLVMVTKAALKERYYSAVMAATGLLYLAILTAFGTDLVARAVLSG